MAFHALVFDKKPTCFLYEAAIEDNLQRGTSGLGFIDGKILLFRV
jgi:hypothetical protein